MSLTGDPILDALMAAAPEGLTSAQIAERCGIHKDAAGRHLRRLTRGPIVSRSRKGGTNWSAQPYIYKYEGPQ